MKIKHSSLFICLIASLCLFFSCKNEKMETLTDCIEFDSKIENPDTFEGQEWNNNMDAPERAKFIDWLFTQVEAGKAMMYDARFQKTDWAAWQKSDSSFTDLAWVKRNIKAIRFREKWTYNPETYKMEKTVLGFCPILVKTALDADSIEYIAKSTPLFWIMPDTTRQAGDKFLITKKIASDAVILNPEIKDTEWFYENLEKEKRIQFIDKLMEDVLQAKLPIYKAEKEVYPLADFKEVYHKKYTYTIITENDESKDTTVVRQIEHKDIFGIRFMEAWQIDTQTFRFEKNVYGINPLANMYAAQGDFMGFSPLFWVFFKEK